MEQTITLMLRHGGRFARDLARLWQTADDANRARIEVTWADMIDKYRVGERV